MYSWSTRAYATLLLTPSVSSSWRDPPVLCINLWTVDCNSGLFPWRWCTLVRPCRKILAISGWGRLELPRLLPTLWVTYLEDGVTSHVLVMWPVMWSVMWSVVWWVMWACSNISGRPSVILVLKCSMTPWRLEVGSEEEGIMICLAMTFSGLCQTTRGCALYWYVALFQIAQSQNRVYLNADTLMLNLKDIEMKEG